MKLSSGLFWGKVEIDTIKETIFISNLDKRSLGEIEDNINRIVENTKKEV